MILKAAIHYMSIDQWLDEYLAMKNITKYITFAVRKIKSSERVSQFTNHVNTGWWDIIAIDDVFQSERSLI